MTCYIAGPLYVHLPLQAEVMGVTLTQPDTAVVIQSKNMFASGPHANFTGGAALTSFKDFGPRQLVMVLKQLATLLDNYRDVGPLGFELPFTHNKVCPHFSVTVQRALFADDWRRTQIWRHVC